jgi:hypothetical protein
VPLLGTSAGARLDDALDGLRSGVSLRVPDAGGHDDRLASSGDSFLALDSEVGLTRQDD